MQTAHLYLVPIFKTEEVGGKITTAKVGHQARWPMGFGHSPSSRRFRGHRFEAHLAEATRGIYASRPLSDRAKAQIAKLRRRSSRTVTEEGVQGVRVWRTL